MIEKELAIMSLRPGAEWTMAGGDVESIVWHTPGVEPLTEAEVSAEMERLQAEIDAERQAREDARASAVAKLEALGLTVDEVSAAFGIEV